MSRVVGLIIEGIGVVGLLGSAIALALGNWWGLATGIGSVLVLWIGFLAEEGGRSNG